MESLKEELEKKRKEFGTWFIYSLLGILLFYIIFIIVLKEVANQPFALPKNMLVLGFCIAAYTSYMISRTKYDFVSIYRIIIVSLFCVITYMNMLLCDISKTIFVLYIPVTLMVMLVDSFKKTIYFGLIVIIMCFFIPEISGFFHLSLNKDMYKNHPQTLFYQEYIVVAITAYFSFLILYFYNQIKKIEFAYEFSTSEVKPDQVGNNESLHHQLQIFADESSDDKMAVLYIRILEYMDAEKPYRNPDFNIKKLSELLDTNTTYVSRALNIFGKKKFNQLINEYRINQVKEAISTDIHRKFTLEHIYTNAGFSQQSTFNRIFKEQTGVTPSEYIETIK